MAYTTGTCTGHLELLDALKAFLTTDAGLVAAGQAWVCLADVVNDSREIYFKGTGLAGEDEIHIGFKVYEDTANDVHNLAVVGFTGYRDGIEFISQPGYGAKYLTLSDQSMRYWFIANGRRVIIIAYVNSNYVTAYAGFFLPFANPSAYPYPMFCGANTTTKNKRYSTQDADNTNFFLPQNASYPTAMYMYGGVWRSILYSTVQTTIGTGTGYYLHQIMTYGMITSLNRDEETRYMVPLDIVCSLGMLGRLDGVQYTTGFGAVAEDMLTDPDGVTWLLIPDVFRTSLSQYAAFRLE